MRCVGWRGALPLIQLATYILLIWYGCPCRPTWAYLVQPRNSAADGFWIDGPMSWQEQVATGLSFPAVFSHLLLLPFDSHFHSGATSELAKHVVMAIFVPLLWYAIGSGIDRHRIRQICTRSLLMKGIMAVILALLLILAILVVMVTLHRAVEMLILQISVLFWLGFGIWAVLRWFRWQKTQAMFAPPAGLPD